MSLNDKLEAARVALAKCKERQRQRERQSHLQHLAPTAAPAATPKAELSKPGNNNKLLAGNLAHEFLTHGTLLGRRIEPTRQPARPEPEPKHRYAEVSRLLMANEAHIPGVVNPTQLAGWLQIKE